ncbi:unnamed protein product [Rotaria magnacalcarata]|uniref:Glycosyltransferase 61 catalytic domain-containing protein n=1 Tax=Rotaria magnacalcarata TaxID=392030 RepID=A0A816X5T7_9BILA|nr:unnamed protein product [Rotaria magnacalcarata]CAF4331402.1 unnamed protein product [Rotaria magnacalcarata]
MIVLAIRWLIVTIISIVAISIWFLRSRVLSSDNAAVYLHPNSKNNSASDSSFSGVRLPLSFASHYAISSDVPLSEDALNLFYSSFRCLGGDPGDFHTEDSWGTRHCIFHNVCLHRSGSSSKYIIDYFYPSSVKSLSSTVIRWNNTFLALRHGANHITNGLSVVQVQLVPMNHVNQADPNCNLSYLNETYLIYQILPDGDMNFGHVIFDDAFGLYANLKQFRETRYNSPNKNHVLAFQSCSFFPGHLNELCRKFTEAVFPVISSHSLRSIDSLFNSSLNSGRLCFRELVAGQGSSGAIGWGHNNFNRAQAFSQFRSELLLTHGISPRINPRQHHILLINKNGRRKFNNLNEIYSAILSTPRYAGINITIVNDFKNSTITQQLQLFQTVTVAISPCGGISMLFFFLPPQSTLIVSGFPNLVKDGYTAGRMESQLWDYQSHVHVTHYPVNSFDDFTLPSQYSNKDWWHLRDHADITLKIEKLFPLIDKAIITAALKSS